MAEPSKKQKTHDAYFSEITLPPPQQVVFNGVACPLVLKCNEPESSVSDVVSWVKDNQGWIEGKLSKHGAILFRGFPVATADNLDKFICAFEGWEDLSYEDSLSYAVRLRLTGRVCTTNEGKTGGMVFHHEQAQTPKYPSKVIFFCENPATKGGGTGVCPSDEVCRGLEEKYPEFVKNCEEKGVCYTGYLLPDADPSKGVGRGWKGFFQRDTKEEVEKRMKELGYTWEWMGDTLKSTSPPLPAVRTLPSGKKVFFNQVVAQIANALEFSSRSDEGETKKEAELDLDRFMTWGDGTSMDVEALKYAKKLCEASAVELQWQAKDIGLLDNMQVMHARRTFEGPRKVYASLVN